MDNKLEHQPRGGRKLYAEHILDNRPTAKIAILWLNDEFGREYLKGFKDGLGERASTMIVGEQTYESTDPTVDSQILTLRASAADTFFNVSPGKLCWWRARASRRSERPRPPRPADASAPVPWAERSRRRD
jgi:hypothetical protein